MLYHIEALYTLLKGNFYDSIVAGVIMVSAIIVFIGLMKPLVFDRISCKPLRKVLVAFTDIAMCFGATAITFWVKDIAFTYYLYASAFVSVGSIVVYWLYENTLFRNLIHKIGSITLKRIYKIINSFVEKEDVEEIKKELKNVSNELKSTAKKEIKDATKKFGADKELQNL